MSLVPSVRVVTAFRLEQRVLRVITQIIVVVFAVLVLGCHRSKQSPCTLLLVLALLTSFVWRGTILDQ